MLGTNELINLYSLDKALKFSFSVSLRRFLGTKNRANQNKKGSRKNHSPPPGGKTKLKKGVVAEWSKAAILKIALC